MTAGRRRSRRRPRPWLAIAALLACGAAGCAERDPVRSDVELEPSASRAFVLNGTGETLSVVDLETDVVRNNVAVVGALPNHLALSADRRTLWVTASGDNRIEGVDVETLESVGGIDLGPGSNPWELAVAGDGTGYVAHFLSDEVVRVDLGERRVTARVPVAPSPEGLAVAGGRVFVASTLYASDPSFTTPGLLSVIEGDTVVDTVIVGRNPQSVVVVDGAVHVVCTGRFQLDEGEVVVVDASTLAVVDRVALGGSPGFAAPAGDRIYVAGFYGGLMAYARSDGRVLHGAGDPLLRIDGLFGLDWDEVARRLYVAAFADDLVLVVEADTLAGRWAVGDGPQRVVTWRPGGALPWKAR